MQILGGVPEVSGADAEVRFRKVDTYFRLCREKSEETSSCWGWHLMFCFFCAALPPPPDVSNQISFCCGLLHM